MLNKQGQKLLIILAALLILPITLFAHAGRTDSNGGHKDNKNKSGLGPYHYHCGEYPAHLHENGICPYKQSSIATVPSRDSEKSTFKYTEKESTFIINGTSMKINTINVNGTNLVELRTLCNELGISVAYNPEMKSMACTKGDISFILQIDSNILWLNDELHTLDITPIVHKGKTMIPARVVAEAVGKVVAYNASNGQIAIQ